MTFFLKIILDAFFVLIKMQAMQKSKEKKMKNTSGPLSRWNYLSIWQNYLQIYICMCADKKLDEPRDRQIRSLYVCFLEKAMAPHSSTLAWKIPWIEKPGRLQSMGLLRVGHDWATTLSLFTFMHWRRKWHPTPVFLPGESQGLQSLVGYRLWGRTESDTTEAT